MLNDIYLIQKYIFVHTADFAKYQLTLEYSHFVQHCNWHCQWCESKKNTKNFKPLPKLTCLL